MANSNLAYDFSRYEYAEEQAEQEKKIRVRKRYMQEGNAAKIFLAAAALCALLCFVIYGNVETNSLYNQIAATKSEIDAIASDNVRMQSEIEGKTSLKTVEYYAENVLGMQKLDSSQKEYIEIENGSAVEIPDASQNIFVKIKNKFYEVVEYLRG